MTLRKILAYQSRIDSALSQINWDDVIAIVAEHLIPSVDRDRAITSFDPTLHITFAATLAQEVMARCSKNPSEKEVFSTALQLIQEKYARLTGEPFPSRNERNKKALETATKDVIRIVQEHHDSPHRCMEILIRHRLGRALFHQLFHEMKKSTQHKSTLVMLNTWIAEFAKTNPTGLFPIDGTHNAGMSTALIDAKRQNPAGYTAFHDVIQTILDLFNQLLTKTEGTFAAALRAHQEDIMVGIGVIGPAFGRIHPKENVITLTLSSSRVKENIGLLQMLRVVFIQNRGRFPENTKFNIEKQLNPNVKNLLQHIIRQCIEVLTSSDDIHSDLRTAWSLALSKNVVEKSPELYKKYDRALKKVNQDIANLEKTLTRSKTPDPSAQKKVDGLRKNALPRLKRQLSTLESLNRKIQQNDWRSLITAEKTLLMDLGVPNLSCVEPKLAQVSEMYVAISSKTNRKKTIPSTVPLQEWVIAQPCEERCQLASTAYALMHWMLWGMKVAPTEDIHGPLAFTQGVISAYTEA